MKLRKKLKKSINIYKQWKKEHIREIKIRDVWGYAKNFYQMLQKNAPTVLVSIVVGGIVAGILPFVSLYYSSRILDALLEANIELAKMQITILLVARLVLGCIDRFCAFAVKVLAKAGGHSVRKQTTQKAFTISYEKYETTETMDKVRRTKNFDGNWCIDEQIEQSYNVMKSLGSVICAVIFTGQLMVKACQKPLFTLYTVILLLVILFFLKVMTLMNGVTANEFVSTVPGDARYHSATKAVWYNALNVQNGKDIRLYKMHKLIFSWHQHWVEYWSKIWCKCITTTSRCFGATAALCQVLAAVAFIYVGLGVLEGVISIGEVMLYTGAIAIMVDQFNDAVVVYNMVGARFGVLNDFGEFINSDELECTGALTIDDQQTTPYELEVKNVSFKYPGTETFALKNVNLKLQTNKRLAIVGQNGSGKTTLIKLLCRLYEPTEGEILLNGINVKEYDYKKYSEIFAVVFQDFQLFALPLDENIAGSMQVNEQRCIKVLEDIGLKETVMKWPDREHTLLYKNLGDGINVSGGEAQKIAIARALYKDAPVVILDEPTAALDPIAEAEIYENFNELVAGKTSIFISHRMSSCKFCDEIIVLEHGEITQKGSHHELLLEEGMYRSLWNAQAQYYA